MFENRFRDWSLAHPRQWTAAADTTGATQFISAQVDRVVKAQLAAADKIIIGQERLADEIDQATLGINRVAEGLESLAATFEWGFSELVWQIEEQRKILQEILDVLRAPLDTQAKELQKRAENAYKNGWFDDALEDFLESEKKNRYDFTTYQNLGNIYLFEKKTPEKALKYYEKAVKYATPESPYHASFALLHIGLVSYLQGDLQGAYGATLKAIELSPELYEAHYQHAQYCASLGRSDEALRHLWKAIEGDRYYCIKADSERDFNVMKDKLRSFFTELRDKAQSQADNEIKIVQGFVKEAKSDGVEMAYELSSAKRELNEAITFLNRGSLFDCWDAIYKTRDAKGSFAETLSEYIETLSKQINETKGAISKWKMMDWEDPAWLGLAKGGSFIVFFLVLFVFGGVWALGFGLPSALGLRPQLDPYLASVCYWAVVSAFSLLVIFWTTAFAVKRTLSSRYKDSEESKLGVLEKKLSMAKEQERAIQKSF
jgi:tetratricopeptide (TPR) repeat protein